MRRALIFLLGCSCGVGTPMVPGPEVATVEAAPAQASTAAPPPAASQCVPETSNGLWGCDTLAALELLEIELISWPRGQPAQLRVHVRNNAQVWVNYPGVHIETSGGGSGVEQRYGMWACRREQFEIQVDGLTAQPGQTVTFKAVASAITIGDSEPCNLVPATLSRSFTAP